MLAKIKLSSFVLAIWVLFLIIPASGIAQIKSMSTKDIALLSERAVLAKCISVDVRRVENYGGNIFTFIEFEVLEKIFGDIGDSFTLRFLGGEIGDIEYSVMPAYPTFTPGEEVILLLGADNDDGHPIIFHQGEFRIMTNRTTGEKSTKTPVTGMTIYRSSDGSAFGSTPSVINAKDLIYTLKLLNEN